MGISFLLVSCMLPLRDEWRVTGDAWDELYCLANTLLMLVMIKGHVALVSVSSSLPGHMDSTVDFTVLSIMFMFVH